MNRLIDAKTEILNLSKKIVNDEVLNEFDIKILNYIDFCINLNKEVEEENVKSTLVKYSSTR